MAVKGEGALCLRDSIRLLGLPLNWKNVPEIFIFKMSFLSGFETQMLLTAAVLDVTQNNRMCKCESLNMEMYMFDPEIPVKK